MSAAAVSVSFDNLGEAVELERGQWPEGEPLGRHFSVTRALPRILELLDETGVRATFFVEGLNAELYPGTLRGLAAAGHEIAYHGWRHEEWTELDPAREREVLERGVRCLGELGLRPAGFRPPGGDLTPATPGLLRELGFTYCSPAAPAPALDGLATLPFRWPLLDAFHFMPRFAALREAELGAPATLPPARLRTAVVGALDDAARDGTSLTLVFHPFLAVPEERLAVIRDALRHVRALADAGAVWCAPCRDVAAAS